MQQNTPERDRIEAAQAGPSTGSGLKTHFGRMESGVLIEGEEQTG
jgi:hypothetical protein